MTPRKKNVRSPKKQPARTRDAAKPGKQQQTPTSRIARIPALVRYIFLLLTSLGLTSGLLCLTSEVTLDKLQHLSKDVEEWEVGVLIAWEGIELALAWIMGFSGMVLKPRYNVMYKDIEANQRSSPRNFDLNLPSPPSNFHASLLILQDQSHDNPCLLRDNYHWLGSPVCPLPQARVTQ